MKRFALIGFLALTACGEPPPPEVVCPDWKIGDTVRLKGSKGPIGKGTITNISQNEICTVFVTLHLSVFRNYSYDSRVLELVE